MRPVRTASDLEEILGAERALLFKHSTRCGASLRALREVEAYETSANAVDVYLLDVIADRHLAREVAERIGVRHESPQAILLEDGVPRWHASHGTIRTGVLAEVTADPER